MGLFSKKTISVETQISKLEAVGVTVNSNVKTEDFFAFEPREKLEANPYKGIIEALAVELEREPYTPISNKLWMCDYERIEDHGDYKSVLERLELLTGQILKLEEISDYVDLDESKAWVEFTYKGQRVRWNAKVDDDWLDPEIVVKYDNLLKEAESNQRIYSNHTDYGQSALFGAFTQQNFIEFSKISKIKLSLIEGKA